MPKKTANPVLLSLLATAGSAHAASPDNPAGDYGTIALFLLGAWALYIGLRNVKELKHKRFTPRRRR